MGPLEDEQPSNDAVAGAAGATSKETTLLDRLEEAGRRRRELAAELGESLYAATKDDPALRAGRESLYEEIAAIDAECEGLQQELDALPMSAQPAEDMTEAEGAEAEKDEAVEDEAEKDEAVEDGACTCPFCGTPVAADDLFCGGCGRPVAEVRAALQPQEEPAVQDEPEAMACPECGAPVALGDVFCTNCGAHLSPASAPEPEPVTSTPAFVAPQEPPAAQKVCPKCGRPSPANYVFCMSCGTRLDAAPEPKVAPAGRVCSTCGTPAHPGDVFCMNCGTRLG